MKSPKQNRQMMNAHATLRIRKPTKQTFVNTKPRCAKTIPKWDTALIESSANLLMANKN